MRYEGCPRLVFRSKRLLLSRIPLPIAPSDEAPDVPWDRDPRWDRTRRERHPPPPFPLPLPPSERIDGTDGTRSWTTPAVLRRRTSPDRDRSQSVAAPRELTARPRARVRDMVATMQMAKASLLGRSANQSRVSGKVSWNRVPYEHRTPGEGIARISTRTRVGAFDPDRDPLWRDEIACWKRCA